jgi:hypothetical protein
MTVMSRFGSRKAELSVSFRSLVRQRAGTAIMSNISRKCARNTCRFEIWQEVKKSGSLGDLQLAAVAVTEVTAKKL